MCSGCSGDYAGDFEDSGESTARAGGSQPGWAWGEADLEGNRRDAEAAGRFEAKSKSEWDSQLASLPGSKGESGAEIYEIIVSATRIAEIRIIQANPGEIKETRAARVTEMQAEHKHSKAESAKYYQTRGGCVEAARDRTQLPCFRRVAVCVESEFRRWGRWTRKALDNLRANNFWASSRKLGGEMEAQDLEAPGAQTQPVDIPELDNRHVEARRSEEHSAEATVLKARAYGNSLEEDETQLAAIRELMMRAFDRGVWLTLGEIAVATEFGEASISAQLRHLRKAHHGGYFVEKRRRRQARTAEAMRKIPDARRGPVVWEYRVLPPA